MNSRENRGIAERHPHTRTRAFAGDIGAEREPHYLLAMQKVEGSNPYSRLPTVFNFVKNVSMADGALVLFYAFNQLQGEAGLAITDPLFGRGD